MTLSDCKPKAFDDCSRCEDAYSIGLRGCVVYFDGLNERYDYSYLILYLTLFSTYNSMP